MSGQVAACWQHSAAVIHWSEQRGLLPARTDTADLPGAVRAGLDDLAALPATAGFADPAVNPGADHTPTQQDIDQARRRLTSTPDAGWNTWPIGDLYQQLSAEAVKSRALVQTPSFVADLICDLTIGRARLDTPARNVAVADPACGCGHLLMTAVRQLTHGRHSREITRHPVDVLDQIHGIDLDPYAALIARFRLAARAAAYCRPATWGDLPADLPIHIAAANSLLDEHSLLARGQYHAVIANPPYVTVKDAATREAIRRRWSQVCKGNYSLAVPFMPLLHELAVDGGWVAQLTANSWMKREFGKPLIETYLPTIDLRWVIDTSGVYIPGHGTPTVILVSRNRPPVGDKVHTVLGIRGEPGAPADPARGVVWTAIRQAVDQIETFERFAYAAERAGRGAPPPEAPALPAGWPALGDDLFSTLGDAA